MVREQYVTFETAKLLKEKGFNGYADMWYNSQGLRLDRVLLNDIPLEELDKIILMPTQGLAMAWLREHNIDIIPFHEIFDGDVYWCRIEKKYGNLLHTELQQDPVYKTYEEAVEEAIKFSFKNLV